MGLSHRNTRGAETTFSLVVDQYGRLWLHTKLEGVPVSIDLAEKNAAFEVMAEAMAEYGFERRGAAGPRRGRQRRYPRLSPPTGVLFERNYGSDVGALSSPV